MGLSIVMATLRKLVLPAGLAGLALAGWGLGLTVAKVLFWIVFAIAAVGLFVWGLRRFLWSVGRRLAFSYFLIGVVPISLVVVLLLVALNLLAGFFLGHLYRDGVNGLHGELEVAAKIRAEARARGIGVPEAHEAFVFTFYKNGERVGGDERGPEIWPDWLESSAPSGEEGRETVRSLVALDDGSATVAASAERYRHGVIAFLDLNLEEELERRTDVHVILLGSDREGEESSYDVRIGSREYSFRPLRQWESKKSEAAEKEGDDEGFRIAGVELSGELRALADGSVVSDRVASTLLAPPSVVLAHLFSSSSEVDTVAWLLLLTVAVLLLGVYAVAELMAVFLIFGISRAVNRLSRVTEAVRAGDFSVRIPVKRRDQVGELQSSFNQMNEHLEELVASAAQKEVLEKELDIARELQESLLPQDTHPREGIELATWFEPSAAIGGDYFDILRADEERIVVVIADVSGHGLSAGLRMAMVKAALVLLVEEGKPAVKIFERLDSVVRSSGNSRAFVTSTLAVIDTRAGWMDLINAGHPPTYLLRDGEVREILLPGSPLGSLGSDYGTKREALEPGDVVVWLSDGLIEARDAAGEPFGFEALEAALAGPSRTAAEVRERLLAAVRRHTGTLAADDDRTLVVLRYREVVSGESSVSPSVS